ncbi:hypothetical protein BDV40DRAFT_273405 [Aspergillus tamarii]|uniref:Uncharacterized protein n=1 Tax=Aspergillus tamarii TaxID=41984 RepID=A0A5N6ULT1_ASPTM|nr:hypothetical protein BDV40DRAFT_273405 [Aspergillus tamarii]
MIDCVSLIITQGGMIQLLFSFLGLCIIFLQSSCHEAEGRIHAAFEVVPGGWRKHP